MAGKKQIAADGLEYEEEIDGTTDRMGSLSLDGGKSSSKSSGSCTYQSTKTKHKIQRFYHCKDCFTSEHYICCESCKKHCHEGHNVKDLGEINGYCDCGLSSCSTSCKLGSKCTHDQFGDDYIKQGHYKCHTCWGETSSFGCCKFCAKECHSGHKLVYREPSNFYCDCGKSKHKLGACTYLTTGTKKCNQQFYRCYTCFSAPNDGCCYQCMIHCHNGHNIKYAGTISSFCDCGLDGCAISCEQKA